MHNHGEESNGNCPYHLQDTQDIYMPTMKYELLRGAIDSLKLIDSTFCDSYINQLRTWLLRAEKLAELHLYKNVD